MARGGPRKSAPRPKAKAAPRPKPKALPRPKPVARPRPVARPKPKALPRPKPVARPRPVARPKPKALPRPVARPKPMSSAPRGVTKATGRVQPGAGSHRTTNYKQAKERSHLFDWGTYNTVISSMPGPSPTKESRFTNFRKAMDHPTNTPVTSTYHNHFVVAPREREIQKHIKSGYSSPLSPRAEFHNQLQQRNWEKVKGNLDRNAEAAHIARIDAHFDRMGK